MYFPKGIFPRTTSQLTISQMIISQLATSQCRKNSIFPMKKVLNEHLSPKNKFLNFFLEITQLEKKNSFSFSQLQLWQEHVGGLHPFFKGQKCILRLGWARKLSAVAITCFKENIAHYQVRHLRCRRLQWGAEHCGQDGLGGQVLWLLVNLLRKFELGKLHIWEVATWENTLGRLPLGKTPLGKYLTSSI